MKILPITLAILVVLVLTYDKPPKTIYLKSAITHTLAIRPLGNSVWRLSCHYTYDDGSASNKVLADLNTHDVNYGNHYNQAAALC